MISKKKIRLAKIKWVSSNKDIDAVTDAIGRFDPDKTYGGAGDLGDKLVPDKICGLDCSGIFYFHDGRFEIGGNESDFNRANREMLSELLEWIDSKRWWSWWTDWFWRKAAKKAAMVYYDAVCFGGRSSFNFNKAK